MMEDIYSNLDNYNEETTIEELRNENKELRFQLEDLNVRLENLQKDFDKLCSEHKKLEFNYSSLLKTAKAEVERKTQAIAMLNAEKDKLVIQTFQNRNRRNIPKNIEPANQNRNDKRKNNNNHTNKQSMEERKDSRISPNFESYRKASRISPNFESYRKDSRISPNFESYRKDSRISPKEDTVRPVTDSSVKENISQKWPKIDNKPSSRIKNRRKSMPAFDTPKFSSDEEAITNVEEHYIPKEYPDRHIDRHCRPSMRTSDCSSLEERNSYEQSKDPKNRHHRYGDSDKPRNYDRSDSHRYKRDSPGRGRRRNRDAYEENRTDYDRHRRLESPPNDKYSHYSLRQHPNYEKLHYNDRHSRSNERYATKHKAPEYDEPRSKKMKPNSYQRQYEDDKWNHEKQQIVDEYDKQFTSCQSPDINFIDSSPNNHPVKEIKLSATTKLDDPRKFSDRYVKDSRSKETLLAVHGINVDIPRLPVENTSYVIECVKMPDALKEKPATEDLLNQIYNIDDNLVNASIESGEIPFEPEDEVHLPHDENGQIASGKNSTQTDNIHKNTQQKTYRIPKINSCGINTQNSKNKDVNIDLPVKRKDSELSYNTTEDSNKSKSKRKTSFNVDLKKDHVPELKETPVVIDKPELPTLSIIETDKPPQLPTFNIVIESKHEHEKKKQSKKIVENDLLLSDETSDYTETHKTIETTSKDNKTVRKSPSLNVVQTNEVPSEVYTPKDKSPHNKKVKTKRRHSKHKSTEEHTKPVKQIEKPTKKVKEKHEVKTKVVMQHKFSELFGDSNSLILPEDLGLPTVPVQSQPEELSIFEDAQDAIDVNSKLEAVKELPKLNEFEIPKLPVEIEIDTQVLKLPKVNEIETNKSIQKDETESPKTNTQTDKIDKEIKTTDEIPIKSLYQNLEVGVKPKEDSVKTVVISSGVQPNLINEHKPLVKEQKPININLKALATSTPYKLDTTASPIDVNPKVTETNGHIIRTEVDTLNTTDSSLSNVDVKSNDDVPDVRIVLKRRRRVMKKP